MPLPLSFALLRHLWGICFSFFLPVHISGLWILVVVVVVVVVVVAVSCLFSFSSLQELYAFI